MPCIRFKKYHYLCNEFMRSDGVLRVIVLLGAALLAGACSTTRYVPDGEYLLGQVKVNTVGHSDDINVVNMRNYVRQKPNARWFSRVKLPLITYSLSGRDTTRWLNRTLRTMGEQPVLYSPLLTLQTCDDLRQELQNQGYMHADVEAVVKPQGDKKINVVYLLKPGDPYFLRNIRYEVRDSVIARLLDETADSTRRLIKEGQQFNASRLDAERKRLTQVLTNHGYSRFHKEFITYDADTMAGSRMIDVVLRLGLFRRDELPDTLHTRYRIGQIRYASGDMEDSTIHLRSHVLEECTHIKPGQLFSASDLQDTYNHFGRIQAVKYTSISFSQRPDSLLLDCNILLQTNKPSTISFQPEGTNTAGDLGAAASLTYQNCNLFRGSELLSVELRGAYEAIRGLEGYQNQDFLEYSLETRLAFPRFILPYVSNDMRRSTNATSEVSLLYDLQNRPEFHRRVLSAAWRYKWSRPNRHDRYQVDVLDLNYVFMPWLSETFHREFLQSESSANSILRYNYEDLFITKTGFGYSYNRRDLALKWGIETSGNLLSLGAHLFHSQKDDQGQHRFFNIAFAQYVKADFGLTRSYMIDQVSSLVFHLGLGIAYPYGNSRMLPFEKRYFSGGANSVRGWSVRSLGPGRFKEHDGRINFINQTGDMKIDLNAEYRTHLFWKLDWALFTDAGNIWTLRNNEIQPGGQFRFDTFVEDLAVSYGMGFRFNFDYFILRFDFGMKAVNPAYETDDGPHFPLLHPRLSRDLAFHFAVGMPF